MSKLQPVAAAPAGAAAPPAEPGAAPGPTRALARFVVQGRPADLPPAVVHQATRCLVDWLGVALGGQQDRSVAILLDYARLVGGARQASVAGRAFRTSAPLAALLNGQASHVLDFDDTFASAETTLHGTPPVYSAALAVGEWQRASGAAVLNAFVLGFEVAARVALALGPAHYDAGWHVTGTAGRFGAAAAAGKLLGLSATQLARAFGIVGTQAGGMKAVYGTMGKPYHAARAAHDGVAAALVARAGFTAGENILEARYGLLELYTREARPECLTLPSPLRYAVLDDGFKPYPCGSLIHATIDAALDALAGARVEPQAVERVEAWVNPYTATVTAKPDPTTGLEAKFSAQHCVAVALAHGRGVIFADFSDAAATDPTLRALRARVRLHAMPDCPKDAARIAIHLRDGRTLQADVPHARGTVERPLDDAGLDAKFLALAEPVLGARARRLLARAWAFATAPDAGALLRATRPAPSGAR
ncbi:MAG TPA: MmgE/PrpD family protein [Chloroflexota bacterium]|nr:MmgE/PrpD family protein [Chloroflexota bacterium]